MKKIVYILLVGWLINCLATTAWAATDQAAKEETTPPAAEGPLTPDQIPPIASLPEGTNNTQSAPATNDTHATAPGETPTAAPDQTSAPASSAAPTTQQQPYTVTPTTGQ